MERSQSKGTSELGSARYSCASDHCRCFIPPPEVPAARERNARLRSSPPRCFHAWVFLLRHPARADKACHWGAPPGVRHAVVRHNEASTWRSVLQVEGGFLPDDKYETIKATDSSVDLCWHSDRMQEYSLLVATAGERTTLPYPSSELTGFLCLFLLLPAQTTASGQPGEDLPMIVSSVCEAIVAHQACCLNAVPCARRYG